MKKRPDATIASTVSRARARRDIGSAPHGRGVPVDPPNRFSAQHCEREAEVEKEAGAGATQWLEDRTQEIVTANNSPDVGMSHTLNPYRGCEHGCIYCYARPTHEYLGFSAGLDFERKIVVKRNAAELLRATLSAPKWRPVVIGMSGVTDAYQPGERRLRISRACLEVLAEFRNPVFIITKNALVTRDIDLLAELARLNAAAVIISLTTLDPALARSMEPRASRPGARLEAIAALRAAGIPVGVNLAPIIPGLTDEEIPALVAAAASAGAQFAAMLPVRLPFGVKEIFSDWLSANVPARKDKVLNRIKSMRGERLNDARFGSRMRGEGTFAEQMAALFATACRRHGLGSEGPNLSTAHFRAPRAQLDLF